MSWRLEWKAGFPLGPSGLIDGAPLRPDRLSALSREALERVPIQVGARSLPLAEVFRIQALSGGSASLRLEVQGSPRFFRLGMGMEAGTLDVEGDGGQLLGAEMKGGAIRVRGNAGHLAGAAMRGGLLQVEGSAGDFVGGPLPGARVGMRGGEVLVHGNAGNEAGLCQRRGLIAMAGGAGELPGRNLLAGTIVIQSGELAIPGIEMRRGTILGLEARDKPLPGFRRDGPVDLIWLRLLLRRLEELRFPLSERARELLSGRRPLEMWSGDRLSLGRGEVLIPQQL